VHSIHKCILSSVLLQQPLYLPGFLIDQTQPASTATLPPPAFRRMGARPQGSHPFLRAPLLLYIFSLSIFARSTTILERGSIGIRGATRNANKSPPSLCTRGYATAAAPSALRGRACLYVGCVWCRSRSILN
jgi:hypothetical protein